MMFEEYIDGSATNFIEELNASVTIHVPALLAILDVAASFILGASLVKLGPLVILMLYAWFHDAQRQDRGLVVDPRHVLRGFLSILLAVGSGRLLQVVLPMRLRPRFVTPEAFIATTNPLVMQEQDWSSLPSDHAALVAALVVTAWWYAPRAGLLAALWGLFYVCLPRIYYGLHYVSDILAGLALGGAIALLIHRLPLPAGPFRPVLRMEQRWPAVMILALFVMGWEIIDLFETTRRLLSAVAKGAAHLSASAG
ncbi:phosphatase PAP2 family protein [Roseicella aquatilis]|uniref:Phosphatase PAP2 family protein n=1 Tax=Roseicella aquatilis TaxID=2527868 RepID=A0A4R4D596_9PROT|nr:phosphatase PAP2 family protein [Roseicella aquatilis]TCZ53950.1 phosphatase PAP2 family protein [Roseicella aquatilis]